MSRYHIFLLAIIFGLIIHLPDLAAQPSITIATSLQPFQTSSVLQLESGEYVNDAIGKPKLNGYGMGFEMGISSSQIYLKKFEYSKYFTLGMGLMGSISIDNNLPQEFSQSSDGKTTYLGFYGGAKFMYELNLVTFFIQAHITAQYYKSSVNFRSAPYELNTYDQGSILFTYSPNEKLLASNLLLGGTYAIGIEKNQYFVSIGINSISSHQQESHWSRIQFSSGERDGIPGAGASTWEYGDKFSYYLSFGRIFYLGS